MSMVVAKTDNLVVMHPVKRMHSQKARETESKDKGSKIIRLNDLSPNSCA